MANFSTIFGFKVLNVKRLERNVFSRLNKKRSILVFVFLKK